MWAAASSMKAALRQWSVEGAMAGMAWQQHMRRGPARILMRTCCRIGTAPTQSRGRSPAFYTLCRPAAPNRSVDPSRTLSFHGARGTRLRGVIQLRDAAANASTRSRLHQTSAGTEDNQHMLRGSDLMALSPPLLAARESQGLHRPPPPPWRGWWSARQGRWVEEEGR